MTERHEHLPGLSEREVLEGMGTEALVDHILRLGERATHIERKMNEAADILEGAYGLTVDDVLSARQLADQAAVGETKNGNQ